MRRFLLLLALALTGCCTQPRALPATRPARADLLMQRDETLNALVALPRGWRLDRDEQTSRHIQRLWISPTGDTAFAVIRIKLPLPVPGSLVMWKFVDEMKKNEGQAELLDRRDDAALGGIRFVAQGGRYRVHANLIRRGFTAWVIYAGTLTARGVNPPELEQAEAAREATRVPLE